MNISQIYIFVSVIVLAVVALLFFFVRKSGRENRLSTLASIAFAFVLAGILFGDDGPIGYSLMGVGVLLAVIEIFNKSKRK
ncbi:MAG TPA: hypothetical protein VLT51_12995 [Anaerolineales bacterium]|nr:hypothetical protein [Anaerolineales bacterium]